MHEYIPSTLSLTFSIAIIFPGQSLLNSVMFLGCQIYFVQQVLWKYEVLPAPLLISNSTSTLAFMFSSYVLNKKLVTLYKKILENKKLIAEMKRLLEAFPHGVIIQKDDGSSEPKSKQCFTNREFQQQIQNIRNNTEHLKRIRVAFDSKFRDQMQEVKTTLFD